MDKQLPAHISDGFAYLQDPKFKAHWMSGETWWEIKVKENKHVVNKPVK